MGRWALRTPDGRWHYALTVPVDRHVTTAGKSASCWRVKLRVTSGVIGVGLVDASGSAYVSNEEQIEAGEEVRTVFVVPDPDADCGALVIRNCFENGPSSCVLSDLSAFPIDQVPRRDYLIARSRRLGGRKWSYAFDLGHGVVTETNDDGAQEFTNLRSAVIFDLFRRYVGRFEGLRCLDAACSSGFFSFIFAEMGFDAVDAFDLDAESIAQAKIVQQCGIRPEHQRIRFSTQDLLAFQPPDEKYDVVFCAGTLQSVTDLFKATRLIFESTKRWAFIHSWKSEMTEQVLELSFLFQQPGLFPSQSALVKVFELAGFRRIDVHLPYDDAIKSLLKKCTPYHQDAYERKSIFLAMEK